MFYRKTVTGTNVVFSVMRVMSVGGVIRGGNSLYGYSDQCRELCQLEVIHGFQRQLEQIGRGTPVS